MAATDVSICSNALLLLGAQPINDFNEENDRTRLAANLFPYTRDAILRAHPWNCAVKRLILAPEVATPAFDYSKQFLLPSDWLRLLQVGETGGELDYRIESGRVLADIDALPILFIFRNEVVSSWDQVLVDVMTHAMAHRMAYAITKSTSMEEARLREFEMIYKRAKGVDGLENPPETLGDYPLLRSRHSRMAS